MSLLSWMPFVMQGLSLLSNIITSSNSSSASNSNSGGQEFNRGNETTTGSLTGPQQIGSTQIGTPTGFGTYSNQGSVTNANMMSFISSILSNAMNAGSQASAKKYNSAEAAAERAFAKEMRGTAYQDTVKDMIAAGINPILAASNGATATPSGASASIGAQRYNQQSAQAASVSAMYEYGNNTAEIADKYLELAKKATSAKQYHSAKSWNEAATTLAQSSAKQVADYSYMANKLADDLLNTGKDIGNKVGKAADEGARKWSDHLKNVPLMPNTAPNLNPMRGYTGD